MKLQLPLLLALATSLSAVPSDINYQGRLTDANGDAVTGDVSMSVKMYDAQSGGNEIYSEDIGTVTLDENGVYSFQFGASGNSTVTKTETIVTSDGTSTEYTGTFTSTPIDGTISVTDETYSWNDIDGNPGEQATAYIIIINGFVIFADIENGGSGYDDDNPPLVTITGDGSGASATATVENGIVTGITITGPGIDYTVGDIAIAPPPAPFTVDKVDGNLEVGYASSPTNGTGVVATYKTLEQSIIGALSEASSHWLELTVDGTAQNPRERILSVPFAQVAGVSERIINESKSSDEYKYLQFKYPYENVYNKDFMSEEVIIKEGEVMEILDARGNGDNGTAKIALRTPLGYEWRTDYRFKFHIEQNGLQRQEGYSGMIGRHIVGPATVKIGYKYPENLIGMLGNSNSSNDFYKWNITDSNEESEFWGHIAYVISKSSDEYKYLQFKYPYENVYNKDFMSEVVIIKEGEVMEILDARGNGDNGQNSS